MVDNSDSNKKRFFNEDNEIFDADSKTQNLSARATVEEYDYKVKPNDYTLVESNDLNLWYSQGNLAIQMCLKKLKAKSNSMKLNPQNMKVCMMKMKKSYDMFVN
jgi:hypothetical protein